MRSANEKRDLTLLRRSGSTTRVLNLSLAAERFGATPEYSAAPFFAHRRLNRALIVKHVLRGSERDAFVVPPGPTTTKVVLPFSTSELKLGGPTFFINQSGFERILQELLSYASLQDLNGDLEILRMLAALPSLDPFLLRERMKRHGRDPARCYFDVSEADLTRMHAFVAGEIAQLVALAFASYAGNASTLAQRLADKLMTDENAETLEPLRVTLRLSGEEYREGIFAWKGFLYYKWCMSELTPRLPALLRAICQVRVVRPSPADQQQIATLRERIVKLFEDKVARVREQIAGYDAAFQALSKDEKPHLFREFLIQAPTAFLVIGEAVGVISHIDSFWRYRFPSGAPAVLDVIEAVELLSDFETTLGGAREAPAPTLSAW